MNKEILKHVIRYVLMILIIAICWIIFVFSSEDGEKSTAVSGKVAQIIIEMNLNEDITDIQLQNKVSILQPFIRKGAHFTIYATLGCLIIACSLTFKKGTKLKKFVICILFAFVYACTDELHQKFVCGRSGQLSDVCLDTAGAITGIIITIVIYIMVDNSNKKKNKTKILAQKNDEIKLKTNVIFIASTGGHLNELLQVKPLFEKFNYHIITERNIVDISLKEEYQNKIRFLIYGTRKYPIKYIFKFVANCFISLYYFFRYQPEVIVTTGTHTAVPMCYIAKIFGSKVIFIETFANRTTGTLAGKLVYPIADTFVVQWEEMHKIYPKSVCWGWIY